MNRKIVASALIIGVSGVVRAWTTNGPITRVVVGTYVLVLMLSIADMFGGALSHFSSAIAMIAVVYVLLNEFPWQTILSAIQGGKAS